MRLPVRVRSISYIGCAFVGSSGAVALSARGCGYATDHFLSPVGANIVGGLLQVTERFFLYNPISLMLRTIGDGG